MANVCTHLSVQREAWRSKAPCNPYVQRVSVQFLQGLFRNIWHCTAGLIICAHQAIKFYWASPEPAAFISSDGNIPTQDEHTERTAQELALPAVLIRIPPLSHEKSSARAHTHCKWRTIHVKWTALNQNQETNPQASWRGETQAPRIQSRVRHDKVVWMYQFEKE